MRRILLIVAVVMLGWQSVDQAQANGKLQIHFIDVGQGDGAILISPAGETILFDNGRTGNCDKPKSYLQQLGVVGIDYFIASHYHADHIGCTAPVFTEFPLKKTAFDHGTSIMADVNFQTQPTYLAYVATVGTQRRNLSAGSQITLDEATQAPVVIDIVSLNGKGGASKNENDLSVVAVVRFGNFRAVLAGDLSGEETARYHNVESTVAPKVGHVDVYKVNHHGSDHSSNATWVSALKPTVGIISVGDGNAFGHPRVATLQRLHNGNVKTYWTERGAGVQPVSGKDVVGGNIIVEVAPEATSFTVAYGGTHVDTYTVSGVTPTTTDPPRFAWSKKSAVYHKIECAYVRNISPANLEKGTVPPPDKSLHADCPR
jgi:competence protein ComEC